MESEARIGFFRGEASMRSEAITVGFRISGAESVKNKYFEAGTVSGRRAWSRSRLRQETDMILNSDNEERHHLPHHLDHRHSNLRGTGSFRSAEFAATPCASPGPEPGVTASAEDGYTTDLYCRASPGGRSAVWCAVRILPWQRCRRGRIRSRPYARRTGCSGHPRR